MKRKDPFLGLIALIFASLIALADIGCLITAFDLPVDDLVRIMAAVVILAGIFLLLIPHRKGWLIFAALGILLFSILLQQTDLLSSIESMLYRITRCYDNGYGWGYIQWSSEDLTQICTDGGLLLIGILVALPTGYCVRKRAWIGIGLLAGLLPLIACCVVTDTVPDAGWLWLLLTTLLVFTLTHLSRRDDTADGTRILALMLIPVVLVSSLLFRFSSSDNYQAQTEALRASLQTMVDEFLSLFPALNFGSGGNGTGSVSVPTRLDLSQVGPTAQKKNAIMKIDTTQMGTFYLRGRAYDTYTGTGWEANRNTINENGWPTSGMSLAGSVTVTTYFVSNLQYTPYYVRSENWTAQMKLGAITNPNSTREYQFDLMLPNKPYAQYTPLSSSEEDTYCALPEDTYRAAEAILENLLSQHNPDGSYMSTDELANLIGRYVCFSAEYDLDCEAVPEGTTDFAIWFLEEGESGYCTHFATAATVLLRAAGIPARYVTGYLTNLSKQSNTVTADQAHAWVEYLHPDYGWTVLDPTPGLGSYAPETEPTEPSTAPTETTLPTETALPTESTLPTGTTRPTQGTRPTGTTPPTTETPTETAGVGGSDPGKTHIQWNLEWIKTLLWILAVWALLAGQYRLRQGFRRKKMTAGDPNRQALARWKYVKLLSRLTGLSAASLLPLAEKAVFSQYSLTDEELAQFDAWIAEAEQRLAKKRLPAKLLIRLVYAIG